MQITRKESGISTRLEKANSFSINQTKELHHLPVQQMIHSHKLRVNEY
ncbi:hypothetical protein N7931_10145 [Catenovulum sp. 2E275]|nr:hypothetical protein [Catenovulum sp. 2E275]MCU4675995.1 hypothetical protein [Catenovulum sp. 2E275]